MVFSNLQKIAVSRLRIKRFVIDMDNSCLYLGAWVKGGSKLKEERSTLKGRIREGRLRREDVLRRLAELAFGQPNDCVRLALEELPDLKGLDLSLLSEIRRSDKGLVEIKLCDRMEALQFLAQATEDRSDPAARLLEALDGTEEV